MKNLSSRATLYSKCLQNSGSFWGILPIKTHCTHMCRVGLIQDNRTKLFIFREDSKIKIRIKMKLLVVRQTWDHLKWQLKNFFLKHRHPNWLCTCTTYRLAWYSALQIVFLFSVNVLRLVWLLWSCSVTLSFQVLSSVTTTLESVRDQKQFELPSC